MERFDDEAVRRILGRARSDDGDAHAPGVDAEALVSAAAEVGYDPVAVRDSIAIERLGAPAASPSMLDRAAGPGEIVVDVTVERSVTSVLDLAEAWLGRVHRMSCRRMSPGTLVARRRSDVTASVGRSVTELRGDGRIGRLASVRVDAVPLAARAITDGAARGPESPAERSAVRLTADRTPARRARLTAGGLLGGTGVATAAVGVAEALFAWPIAAVVLTGAGGVTVASGRRHADRVEADLEGLVAAIIAGDEPVGTLRRVARAARRSIGG